MNLEGMIYEISYARWEFLRGYEADFLVDIGLSLLAGFLIGAERESRGKAAGISTHFFVFQALIFTYLSAQVDSNSSSRITALNFRLIA